MSTIIQNKHFGMNTDVVQQVDQDNKSFFWESKRCLFRNMQLLLRKSSGISGSKIMFEEAQELQFDIAS